LLGRDPLQNIPLLGRADHDDSATEIGAKIDQSREVFGRSVSYSGVRVIQVEALGFDQHPVDAGNGNPAPGRRLSNPQPFARRDIRHRIRQRKGRDLHAIITQPRGLREDVLDLPVPENFVADGEFHWAESVSSGA